MRRIVVHIWQFVVNLWYFLFCFVFYIHTVDQNILFNFSVQVVCRKTFWVHISLIALNICITFRLYFYCKKNIICGVSQGYFLVLYCSIYIKMIVSMVRQDLIRPVCRYGYSIDYTQLKRLKMCKVQLALKCIKFTWGLVLINF